MLKKKVAAAVTAALGMTAMSSANAAIGPFDFTAWGGFLGAISTIPYAYDDDSVSVALDPKGNEAQVLVFPYYTVNQGGTNGSMQSSFNIRNTKDEFKGIRIRFRESGNSLDVLDFNVYLSPYDMFTMTLQADPNNLGGVKLTTTDTSCTFPTIPVGSNPATDGVAFKNSLVGNNSLTEGYLVVTEMATFDESAPYVPSTVGLTGSITFAQGIEHTSAGVPLDCSVVATAWGGENGSGGGIMPNGVPEFTQGGALKQVMFDNNPGNYAEPGAFYVDEQDPDDFYYGHATPNWTLPPTGGLVGTGIILDIVQGTALVVDPTPISGYSTWPQHYSPNDPNYDQLPSLSSGNIRVSTVSIHNGDGHEDVMHPYWAYTAQDYGAEVIGDPQGINPFPIADILAVVSVDNEYEVSTSIQGATDWTFTFPMRVHGINGTNTLNLVATVNPNEPTLDWLATGNEQIVAPIDVWDREEQKIRDIFSPSLANAILLNREVNVVEFQNANVVYDPASSSVFGSHFPVTLALDSGWVNGWSKVSFDSYTYNSDSDDYAWWVDHEGTQPGKFNAKPVLTYVDDADRLPLGYKPGYNGVPLIGANGTKGNIGGGLWVGEVVLHNTVVDHMDED